MHVDNDGSVNWMSETAEEAPGKKAAPLEVAQAVTTYCGYVMCAQARNESISAPRPGWWAPLFFLLSRCLSRCIDLWIINLLNAISHIHRPAAVGEW